MPWVYEQQLQPPPPPPPRHHGPHAVEEQPPHVVIARGLEYISGQLDDLRKLMERGPEPK
jgi:hypothetical protein